MTRVSLQAQLVHRAFRALWCNELFLDLFAIDGAPCADVLCFYDDETRRDPRTAWTQMANGRAHFGARAMRDARGRPIMVEMFARRVMWDCGPAVAQSFRALDHGEQPDAPVGAPLLLAAHSPALADAAYEALTNARWIVDRASSRDEAINKMRARAFSCAIIEASAAFAEPPGFCAALRARGAHAPSIPIVALIADNDPPSRGRAEAAPSFDSLVPRREIGRRLAGVVQALVRARLIGPAEFENVEQRHKQDEAAD